MYTSNVNNRFKAGDFDLMVFKLYRLTDMYDLLYTSRKQPEFPGLKTGRIKE